MDLKKNYKYIFCSTLLILIILETNIWRYYPLYSNELFGDWNYIFKYYSCLNNINIIENNCSKILTYKFVYPKIWLKIIHYIYPIFSYLISVIILIYILITFNIFRNIPKIYHLLFLVSPTSILLLQRGNNEILIFLLIFSFISLMKSNKFKYFSIIPFVTCSLLKIYPLSLIFIFIIQEIKKITFLKIFAVAFFFIIILFSFKEFLYIKSIFNLGKVTLVYGADSIFHIVNFIIKKPNLNYSLLSVLSLMIIIVISTCIKMKKYKNLKKENLLMFLVGSTILVSSFFLNLSFEYRFIYIILVLPFFFENKKIIGDNISNILIFLIYFVLWFEFFILFSKYLVNFEMIKSTQGNVINFRTSIVGGLIIIKNLIYWSINFGLIIISKNLIFKNILKI